MSDLKMLQERRDVLVAQREQIRAAIEKMTADFNAHNGALALLDELINRAQAPLDPLTELPDEVKDAEKRGGKSNSRGARV